MPILKSESMTLPDLDTRVQQTGLNLYRLIADEAPSLFRKDYWTGKVLDWCMRDEAFKVEMFRFVDVFPSLATAESVAQHLQEYFGRDDQQIPDALQWGIKSLSPGSLAAKVVAKTIASNIRGMGNQFIVGTTAEEALPAVRDLRKQGLSVTSVLLGESVVSEAEADDYSRRYLELLEALGGQQGRWPVLGDDSSAELDWGLTPKINLSIKPSAMYSQMKPEALERSVDRAKERLRPILRKAVSLGAFVNLDIEHQALKDLTIALFRSLMEEAEFRSYPHTGLAIQAYLRDSEQDLEELIAWARRQRQPVTVRLVKGAYWDAETMWAEQNRWPVPVFTNKHETDANFEKLARLILENRDHMHLACGSHNIRSIAYVSELAKELGMAPHEVEFQVLYGMAEPVRTALRKAGLRLRLYAPIGEMIPGMAYLVRRLLENTSNESFLRQSFAQGVSHEELLRNPLDLISGDGFAVKSPTKPSSRSEAAFHNEPLFDWTIENHRRRFQKALESVRGRFPIKVPMVIEDWKQASDTPARSTNPNQPDEVVGLVAQADRGDAEKAVRAAQAAFPAWRDTDPEARAAYLFRAAEAARRKRYELAALQVFEVGKTWSEADADVCEAIDFLDYYGREMIRLARPQRMGDVPGETSHLFYEPRGVAAVIAPWNFPLAISMGMVSAAIVTGNTVVYKPSSESPLTGLMVYELFREADLPKGVLNFLPGPGGEIGDFLVSHPEVSLIAFTGSREVGLRILRLAGDTPADAQGVKRVVAEMGGKNAIIVDADADLDETVLHVLRSAFGYQGQKCSACSRLIVLEEVYETLLERLLPAAESLHLGSAEDPQSFMGAVISESAKRKVERYIEIGKHE